MEFICHVENAPTGLVVSKHYKKKNHFIYVGILRDFSSRCKVKRFLFGDAFFENDLQQINIFNGESNMRWWFGWEKWTVKRTRSIQCAFDTHTKKNQTIKCTSTSIKLTDITSTSSTPILECTRTHARSLAARFHELLKLFTFKTERNSVYSVKINSIVLCFHENIK